MTPDRILPDEEIPYQEIFEELKKNDWKDYPTNLYIAIAWYWGQSRCKERDRGSAEEWTTTWAELALDACVHISESEDNCVSRVIILDL